MAETRMEI
jgi:hypothetical protein